jgi:hypothetical protein
MGLLNFWKKKKSEGEIDNDRAQVWDYFDNNPDAPANEVAYALGIDVNTVRAHKRSWLRINPQPVRSLEDVPVEAPRRVEEKESLEEWQIRLRKEELKEKEKELERLKLEKKISNVNEEIKKIKEPKVLATPATTPPQEKEKTDVKHERRQRIRESDEEYEDEEDWEEPEDDEFEDEEYIDDEEY